MATARKATVKRLTIHLVIVFAKPRRKSAAKVTAMWLFRLYAMLAPKNVLQTKRYLDSSSVQENAEKKTRLTICREITTIKAIISRNTSLVISQSTASLTFCNNTIISGYFLSPQVNQGSGTKAAALNLPLAQIISCPVEPQFR